MSHLGKLALSADDQKRIAEVEQLAKAGAPGVTALVDRLVDPSWAVRRAVVAALGRLGDPAIDALWAIVAERRDNETRLAAAVDALAASRGEVDRMLLDRVENSVLPTAVLCDACQLFGRRRCAPAAPVLARLAGHDDDNVAVAAIEALGLLGAIEAVAPLVSAARSRNFFRTFPAIDALGRTGDARGVQPLVELLADPLYAAEATRALGKSAHAAAVAPLAAVLRRGPNVLRRTAAVALAELRTGYESRFGDAATLTRSLEETGSRDVSASLIGCLDGAVPSERVAIAHVLGWIGDGPAIAKLIDMAEDEAPVSQAATDALRGLGTRATAALLLALRSGDSARRVRLLPILGPSASGAGDVDLAECLNDADPAVRALACEALARAATTAAVPSLFRLLGDPDPRVSQAAAAAIQSLGSVPTKLLALEAARSGDPRMRRVALRIIAYFGYPEGLEVLTAAIEDPDSKIRDTAIQGLPLILHPLALEALLHVARHPAGRTRAAATRALGDTRATPATVEALRAALKDSEPWVRYYACQSLGKLRANGCVEDIVARTEDAAGQVRVAAVEALAHLRDDRAIEALERAARSSDADIRRAAIVGLGIVRSPGSLALLRAAIQDPDAPTRLMAVGALAEFDAPEVVPVLAHATSDPDESVRSAAIGFLSTRPGAAAAQALIALLDNPALRERIVTALAVAADERIEPILSALEAAQGDRAGALVAALVRMRRPSSQAALAAALTFDNVAARRAAASALAALGTREASEVLGRLAHSDPDPEVRRIGAQTARRE